MRRRGEGIRDEEKVRRDEKKGWGDFHGVKCTIIMGPWENMVVQFFPNKNASLFLWACLSTITSIIIAHCSQQEHVIWLRDGLFC